MSTTKQTVRLWEGYHFVLTDEQAKSLGSAFEEIEATHEKDEPDRRALLAQVWDTEDGVVCACHVIEPWRARIIRDVLRSADMLAIKIERSE